ncbi:MAG: DHH family phosphoesterase [Lachnospiraceae bacterium]|nr:DHH family phosphoesterase [Lachnospiraceae bacterium]
MLNIERNNDRHFDELLELLRGKNVYIQTHNFPDPDAIATAYGLQSLLRHYGIPSKICYVGKIDRLNTRKMIDLLDIEIYSKEELGDEMTEDDPIICVDSQKAEGNLFDLIGDEIACIDHHPSTKQVDYFYKDLREVGSCASIITEYYMNEEIPIDRKTATALVYGMQMDTSGFTRGVTDADIAAFGYLYGLADPKILGRLEQNQMEFQDLKAYGAAIENIQLYDRAGFAHIPFPCQDALIAITCDFILSIEEIDIAVVYSKRDNGYKFSVRCEDYITEVDCGAIIASTLTPLGGSGGGHAFMAGGFLPIDKVEALGNDPDEVLIERFMDAISRTYRKE